MLPPPTFLYGKNQVAKFDNERGNWRAFKPYLFPARIKVWAIYALEMNKKFEVGSLTKFAEVFFRECKGRGINISPPAEIKILEYSSKMETLDTVFKTAKKGDCDYIVIITTKEDKLPHGKLSF